MHVSQDVSDDWRAEPLLDKEYLVGVAFQWKRYRTYREGWDHDHCVACLATFAEHAVPDHDEDPILHEGYTTLPAFEHGSDYWWVCRDCWGTFQSAMNWRSVDDPPLI